MNIYEKLAYIQSALKVSKENYNSFGNYKYRSCEDILEGVKPLLKEVGAVVTLTDNIEQIGDRFYVKATATLMDTESGNGISVDAYAREDLQKKGMDLAQVTGSVSSYARKYALNGLFCIDDTKDSDTTNKGEPEEIPKEKPKEKPEPIFKIAVEKYISIKQANELVIMAKEKWGENAEKCFVEHTGYAKASSITADKFDEVIETINNAPPY